MSNLSPVTVYACVSIKSEWKKEIRGSTGNKYIVSYSTLHKFTNSHQWDFSCTCPAYKYQKGYCKHIKKAQKDFCGWNSLYSLEPMKDGKCPLCGNSIYSYTEMV